MRDDYKKWGMITKKCGMITARKNAGWLQINQLHPTMWLKPKNFGGKKFRRKSSPKNFPPNFFFAEIFSADFFSAEIGSFAEILWGILTFFVFLSNRYTM